MKPSMMLLSQVRIPTATKSDLSSRSTRADESSFSDWMNEVSREPLRKQRTDDVDEDALRSAGMAGQTSPLDRSPERNNLRRADEHSRPSSLAWEVRKMTPVARAGPSWRLPGYRSGPAPVFSRPSRAMSTINVFRCGGAPLADRASARARSALPAHASA